MVTAIASKDAEMVADAIYRYWFSKFTILAQIHTDGSKEFINKLSAELFQLLNVRHTKTSPAHPQCNAQVEVFYKTVKKFLQMTLPLIGKLFYQLWQLVPTPVTIL